MANDVEISREMIEAGAAEFMACRPMLTETAEEAAVDIFQAMLAARQPLAEGASA